MSKFTVKVLFLKHFFKRTTYKRIKILFAVVSLPSTTEEFLVL